MEDDAQTMFGFPSFWSTFDTKSINTDLGTRSEKKCVFVPLGNFPQEYIGELDEFESVFSGEQNSNSLKLRLLISLANGHPRTLESIHTVIENAKQVKLAKDYDFNSLFDDVSKEISTRSTFSYFECSEQFLYSFVVHAFFAPNKQFKILDLDKEFSTVETLVSKAIIVDSIKREDKVIFCTMQINLYMFCTFWVIVEKPNCNWVTSLNDLIISKKKEDEPAAKPVFDAFLHPNLFEQYFPRISIFRLNLLVNSSTCKDITSQYTTLGSFFKFSKMDFLKEKEEEEKEKKEKEKKQNKIEPGPTFIVENHSTYYDWEIDFSNPFCVQEVEEEKFNKEMFANLLKCDNWDAHVNIWYKGGTNFRGIDTFCFLSLKSEFLLFYLRVNC